MASVSLTFLKGHGTQNDFVLIPDRDNRLELTAELAAALADRRSGIGGDGVIRVAPTGRPGPKFFMDYRNSDGSLAQMCGNGARLFARFLVDQGWEQPGRFEFRTRGGVRTAELGPTGDVSIGMGPVRIAGPFVATLHGRTFSGPGVDVGNPHLVCAVDPGELTALDLSVAPIVASADFPEGVNVEFVDPLGPDLVAMRVHERGVGETSSCGTGTVAVAAVHLRNAGRSHGRVRVRVPGGEVVVTLTAADPTAPGAGSAPGVGYDAGGAAHGGLTEITGFADAVLTGPAVIVASGEVRPNGLDLR